MQKKQWKPLRSYTMAVYWCWLQKEVVTFQWIIEWKQETSYEKRRVINFLAQHETTHGGKEGGHDQEEKEEENARRGDVSLRMLVLQRSESATTCKQTGWQNQR